MTPDDLNSIRALLLDAFRTCQKPVSVASSFIVGSTVEARCLGAPGDATVALHIHNAQITKWQRQRYAVITSHPFGLDGVTLIFHRHHR